jgi:hypothetical protein
VKRTRRKKSGINPKIAKETQATKEIEASGHTLAHLYKLATDEKIKDPRNPWSAPHIKRIGFSWKHLKPLYNYPISDISKKHLREILIGIHNKTPPTCQSVKNLLSVIYTYAVNNEIYPTNLVAQFAKILFLENPEVMKLKSTLPFQRTSLVLPIITLANIRGL